MPQLRIASNQFLNAYATFKGEGLHSAFNRSLYYLTEGFIGNEPAGVIRCIKREAKRKEYKTFIDIGANVGRVTSAVAQLFQFCMTIEPSPRYFNELVFSTAPLHNCVNFNCALGERSSSATIYYSSVDSGDNTTYPRGDLTPGESVVVDTLDNIVLGRPNPGPIIMKVDAQGQELGIMKGARNTLESTPTVISEFWPWGLVSAGSDPTEYLRFMLGIGYNAYDLWHRRLSIHRFKGLVELGIGHRCVSTDIIFHRDKA